MPIPNILARSAGVLRCPKCPTKVDQPILRCKQGTTHAQGGSGLLLLLLHLRGIHRLQWRHIIGLRATNAGYMKRLQVTP